MPISCQCDGPSYGTSCACDTVCNVYGCYCNGPCHTYNCPCYVNWYCLCDGSCNSYGACGKADGSGCYADYACYQNYPVCPFCNAVAYNTCTCDGNYTVCQCNAMKYAPGSWLFY
jgi:hypothetical protein